MTILVSREWRHPVGAPLLNFNFAAPLKEQDGRYTCEYEILLDGRSMRKFRVWGRDGVEALRRAMGNAVTDLEQSWFRLYEIIDQEVLRDMRLEGDYYRWLPEPQSSAS